ncbi:uncharacterized protein [Parasteatoda tepidariorum]|nr:uncharacterized protein LOC107450378 [Parasteatoda tepidariorum]XP_015921637.1 uncharacterized protein LOC107450378 [Parasteatoda tepidariorum]
MCSNSPTCVLSGPSCIQEPQTVSTISSEVENTSAYFNKECLQQTDSNSSTMGNQSRCCPGILPAITRSHDSDESQRPQQISNPTSSKSSKSNKCGWKTSKFFSKSMTSGEILRSLKKLSLTSSGSTSDPGEPEQIKPRKSKSGQLKKRSSCGNDDVIMIDEDSKVRSPRSPGSFRPLSKVMSVSEPGSTSKTGSLGIVCRKEDLKAILCTASKKFPLASPSKRRKGQAPLRQTKSASFDPADERQSRKEPVRRAGSEESRTKSNSSFENNETTPQPANENNSDVDNSSIQSVDSLNAQNINMNTEIVVDQSSGCLLSSLESSLSTVKWDESDVVDAVIIGDAIETFLKGSMTNSEKKVSFRRNSDKRSKSDG